MHYNWPSGQQGEWRRIQSKGFCSKHRPEGKEHVQLPSSTTALNASNLRQLDLACLRLKCVRRSNLHSPASPHALEVFNQDHALLKGAGGKVIKLQEHMRLDMQAQEPAGARLRERRYQQAPAVLPARPNVLYRPQHASGREGPLIYAISAASLPGHHGSTAPIGTLSAQQIRA
ncbi:hypothetical protein WJX75_001752 [Coccomyxa subellipsoidea]|uniref:Uncharacterized protein n=1 Tax=Coccomyxa subellipsoidea TaxID=248742 RepID=A0ABR2Z3L9_9CHLO